MVTLGIETSCDETSASVVKDGHILSNVVSSSVHLHSPYGGVVPEIASRFHVEYISNVLKEAMKISQCTTSDVKLVAVANRPGLVGSLLIGSAFAKAIGFAAKMPIIEVDHLHAHIFSCFISSGIAWNVPFTFPFLGVVISGGHTNIFICKNFNDLALIGETRDDAIGEAFDKVSKVLGLGYPGGPEVEKRALSIGDTKPIKFSQAFLGDELNLDFSFSGIKTQVLYYWRSSKQTDPEKNLICFSFQEAIIGLLEKKLARAAQATGIKRIAVGGGVINNMALRNRLISYAEKEGIELYLPEREYCCDNAGMVAVLGEKLYSKEKRI